MARLERFVCAVSPGGVSAAGAAAAARAGAEAAGEALGELAGAGIGERRGGLFFFSEGDRLRAALLAVRRGADAGEVSEHLGWRDFEGLAAEVLEGLGFDTVRNLVLRRPRAEIDVAATAGGLSLLVDCKHWGRTSAARLRGAARRQVARARRYAALEGRPAVPAIVTLQDCGEREAAGVPVVPVHMLASFAGGLGGRAGALAVTG